MFCFVESSIGSGGKLSSRQESLHRKSLVMSFKASTVDYDFLSKKVWPLQKMNGLLFVNTQL